jgi:hypothetical protein
MCQPSSLDLQLDFTDKTFSNIDLSNLNVTLTIANFTSDYGQKNIIQTTIPLITFIAPLSKTGTQIYQKSIELTSINGFCPPGSNWYWTGLGNISLGSGTSTNSFLNTNIKTSIVTGYVSAPVAYIAYQTKNFIMLFGNDNLNSALSTNNFTATCSTHSYSQGDDCYYLMKIGGKMGLVIKPNIISVKITTPIPPVPPVNGGSNATNTINNVVFDILKYGIVPAIERGWTTNEKLIMGIIVMIILLFVIAAIIYVVTRKSNKKTIAISQSQIEDSSMDEESDTTI